MPVMGPSLFQGEQSFGTTAGAPLSTDANNQLISGITSGKLSSTTVDTSTTSATTMAGMSFTPVAGTYEIVFTTDINSATAGSVFTINTVVGGVQSEQVKGMPFAGGTLTVGNQRIPVALNDLVTVNGSQLIAIQWSSSTAGMTTAGKRLTYKRLS